MINIPEEIKQLLKDGSVRKNFRVHFPNGEREDITNENIVTESVTLTESLCSQNSLVFGLCETPQIEFETFGVENIRGATIECSLDVECAPQLAYRNQFSKVAGVSQYIPAIRGGWSNDVESDMNFTTVADTTVSFRIYHFYYTESTPDLTNSQVALIVEDAYGNRDERIYDIQLEGEITPSTTTPPYYSGTLGGIISIPLKANETIVKMSTTVYSDGFYISSLSRYQYQLGYAELSGNFYYYEIPEYAEQKPDLPYASYSIPYGKFIVDSCKKQADMTHRQIVGYANKEIKDFSAYPYVKQRLNTQFYWLTSDLKLSINGLLFLSNLDLNDDSQFSEVPYTLGTYNGNLDDNYKITIYYKEYRLRGADGYNANQILVLKTLYGDNFWGKVSVFEGLYDRIVSFSNIQCDIFSSDFVLDDSGGASYIPYPIQDAFTRGPFPDLFVSPCATLTATDGLSYSDYIYIDGGRLPYRCVVTNRSTQAVEYDTEECNNRLMFVKNTPRLFVTDEVLSISPKITSKKVTLGGVKRTKTLYSYDFSKILDIDIREIVQGYCEINGKFGITNREGNLDIVAINNHFAPPLVQTINPSAYSSFWYEDNYSKPIGRLECYYNDGTQSDENKYLSYDIVSNYNSIDYCTYSITENFFIKNNIYSKNEILEIFEMMAGNVAGISYMPIELSMIGRPDIEVGDVVDVYLKDGSHFVSIVESRSLQGIMALSDAITSRDEYASVISGSGSSSSGNRVLGEGLRAKVLWQNPSRTASFAGQTITLEDDIENYDYIGIVCAQGNGSTARTRFLPMIFMPVGVETGALITMCTYRNYTRNFSAISGNSVTISGCNYYATYNNNTTTADNAQLIPRFIYGFKE